MEPADRPYISFVVASRNDDHGGGLRERMSAFIRALIYQSNKKRLRCELLVVEWNPLPGKPLLSEVMPSAQPEDLLSIRYIIVPPEIHAATRYADVLPLHQMLAKNVGIRNASGKFIACTNIDIIFSGELFAQLAKRNLEQYTFYRANRCDVPANIVDLHSVEEMENFAARNILRRWGMDFRYPGLKIFSQNFFMYRYRLFRPFYPLLIVLKKMLLDKNSWRIARLDKEACGDFTLMSKESWLEIKGYPELEIYPAHLDSLALIAAEAKGMRQVIFPPEACVYHIDHEGGWRPGNAKKHGELHWDEIHRMGVEMLKTGGDYPGMQEKKNIFPAG